MRTPTEPEVWVPDNPVVVFIAPDENSQGYAAVTNQITTTALQWLNAPLDYLELVGLIAATPRHGAEGIYALSDMGIDPRSIILLVLWGETSECVAFDTTVPYECGVGFIALPKSGVVLPTICMPSIEGDWWYDPVNQSYAVERIATMIGGGRMRPDETDHVVFVANPATWN